MAEAEKDTLLTIVKSLNETVNEMRKESVDVAKRLQAIEASQCRSPPQAQADIRAEQSDLFERSEEVHLSEAEAESEVDMEASNIVQTKNTGDSIKNKLAVTLNEGLVGVDDNLVLNKLHEANLRPSNLPNLIVPKLNEEIQVSDTTLIKENNLCSVQKNLCTAITIMSRILDDQGKVNHKFTREDIFNKTNDAISILMTTYKDVTFSRKLNIKHLLSDNIKHLCTKKHINEDERSSNSRLFEEDLGHELDKAVKSRRVARKISKNYRGRAPSRGSFRFGNGKGQSVRGNYLKNRGLRGGGVARRGRPQGPKPHQ